MGTKTDYTQRIKDYCDRHGLTEEDALFFFGVTGEALRNERERCARVIGPLMENHKHHCTNSANAGMLWVEVDAAIRKDD